MIIDIFAEDKILRERFLSRDVLSEVSESETVNVRLKEVLFKLGVQLALKLIEPDSASTILSKSVIEKIKSSIKNQIAKKKWKNDYFIIVLGSTGMETMTFASDIDLIFVAKNSTKYPNIQKDFQQLLGILKKELSPFPVDCRLRPEGESSQLVWDFEKYIEYLNKRARIWELQSFLKARFICGNNKSFKNLADSYLKRISQLTEEEVSKEISEMRSKSVSSFPAEMNIVDLKKNPGGLSDIEYIAHYLVLSKKKQSLDIIGKSIPEILIRFKEKKKVLNDLSDNYIFLKKLEIFNQLAFNSSSSKISDDENRYNNISRLMRIKNGHTIKTKLNSVMKVNRERYSEFILKK
jgi:glutamine synthetase adenylyltransferase